MTRLRGMTQFVHRWREALYRRSLTRWQRALMTCLGMPSAPPKVRSAWETDAAGRSPLQHYLRTAAWSTHQPYTYQELTGLGLQGWRSHRYPLALALTQLPSTITHLVDYGCGTGLAARWVPASVAYLGVDIDAPMIAYAQQTFSHEACQPRFIQVSTFESNTMTALLKDTPPATSCALLSYVLCHLVTQNQIALLRLIAQRHCHLLIAESLKPTAPTWEALVEAAGFVRQAIWFHPTYVETNKHFAAESCLGVIHYALA